MPISQSGEPRIAITLGDPAGIGPEITLKALRRLRNNFSADILCLGEASFFSALAKKIKLPLSFKQVSRLSEWKPSGAHFSCYFPQAFPKKIILGRFSEQAVTSAVRSIELAARLAMAGEVDAVVTPPINKAGLKKAGFSIPGHTEFLAKLSGTRFYEMMLVGGPLRVVLTTRHLPLKDVAKNLSKKRIVEAIELTARELKTSFGIAHPRLGICSLNPHAGEQGHLGLEEIRVIEPAVRAAQAKVKARITGPLPPDVLFYQAYQGRYDAEICMYHDQGQIPLKMISRGSGVNVTLGLPFVRTSPDHGTGFDIARRFIADAGSMTEALKLAVMLSAHRKKNARKSRPRS
jgi:4-hydroxythreonine-4-phosphate dehydrogenase